MNTPHVYTDEEKLNVLTDEDKKGLSREEQLSMAEIIMGSVPQNPDNYKLGSRSAAALGLPVLGQE